MNVAASSLESPIHFNRGSNTHLCENKLAKLARVNELDKIYIKLLEENITYIDFIQWFIQHNIHSHITIREARETYEEIQLIRSNIELLHDEILLIDVLTRIPNGMKKLRRGYATRKSPLTQAEEMYYKSSAQIYQ